MKTIAAFFLGLAPLCALAGPSASRLPEPETLALLGIGAVALLIAQYRKRK